MLVLTPCGTVPPVREQVSVLKCTSLGSLISAFSSMGRTQSPLSLPNSPNLAGVSRKPGRSPGLDELAAFDYQQHGTGNTEATHPSAPGSALARTRCCKLSSRVFGHASHNLCFTCTPEALSRCDTISKAGWALDECSMTSPGRTWTHCYCLFVVTVMLACRPGNKTQSR